MSPLEQPSQAERDADAAIAEIDSHFRLLMLTPINLEEERELFLSGKQDNPQFRYEADVDTDGLLKDLEAINIPNTDIGQLLNKKAEEIRNRLEMIAAIGTDRYTEFAQKIYGVPDAETLAEAHRLLKAHPSHPVTKPIKGQTRLSTAAVIKDFQDVLQQYGLSKWKVEESEEIITGVAVSPSRRTVLVRAHAYLDVSRLAPLITHEIESHVLITENGHDQPLRIFVDGFAGAVRTQEGLASYNVTTQHPQLFQRPMRFWARNVVAVDLALRSSFREVYDNIRTLGFNDHFSFGVTAKTKRGMTDTSKPGAFTKDYLYLAGKRDIERFVEGGGDLREIYIGKVTLQDLPLLKKQPWLAPARLLPRFLQESE
jgi:uncharacterized protein (TIGR02421 family)